jgi:predicted phosphodiesterase
VVVTVLCCQCGEGPQQQPEADGNPPPSTFQVIQLSDTHLGKSPQQEENLRHAVAQIEEMGAALVLLTGDLTDHGRLEEYATLKEVLSGISAPYYCVPGDNDIKDGEGDLDRYRQEMGADFYAFDLEGIRFLGINNNSWLSLDEDQRAWLEEELTDGPPAIVFAHRPLLDGNREFEPFRQAAPLLELLESSAVLMYMNGDFHESAEVALNGVHHIWCDNLSFIHTGEETYNLYEIGPDSVRIYHVHLEGTREFVLEFSRL